eukprot:SAG31_NODE_640_length_13322_cov_4.396703_6_plen_148_part_00
MFPNVAHFIQNSGCEHELATIFGGHLPLKLQRLMQHKQMLIVVLFYYDENTLKNESLLRKWRVVAQQLALSRVLHPEQNVRLAHVDCHAATGKWQRMYPRAVLYRASGTYSQRMMTYNGTPHACPLGLKFANRDCPCCQESLVCVTV